MSNKNDRWSALSMSERADLMNMYITNGISDLKEMKKHYNSFDGGDIQNYKEKSLPGNWLQRLAYKFGSDPEVSSKGIASMEDILRILKSSEDIDWDALDNNKATYLFGNILGLFPAGETKGKDYSKYLKENYPLKYILGKIKEYKGTINPFNEYVVDSRDRGLVEELAKKGKGLYSNSDIEYSYMFDTYDTPPYKEDVANYHMQFVNTPNGISVSASDLYDFGKDYNPEDYDDSDNNNYNNLLTDIEVAAFTAVGNPYIYRQENIPIRFIDTNNNRDEEGTRALELSRAWNWANLSDEDLEKGISFDEKIANILDTGYIEPAVVTAKAKRKRFDVGGKLLTKKFENGGNTQFYNNPIFGLGFENYFSIPQNTIADTPKTPQVYEVQQGDSFIKIANSLGVPLDEFKKVNPLENYNNISIGQKLVIPEVKQVEHPEIRQSEESKFNYYTVSEGDSLSLIANKNNMSLDELIKANPQIENPNVISVGQKINLNSPTTPKKVREKQWISVDELREREKEYNKTNLGAIQGATHDSNYVVIDKKGKKLTVYDSDNNVVYETSDISTGLSGNDYNTKTFTRNGRDVYGEGNMSTPAGVTRISSMDTYHGAPSFQRVRLDSYGNPKKVYDKDGKEIDDTINSSFHLGSTDKLYSSNGCVRMSKKALNDLSKYIDVGTLVYTLPDKNESRFVLKDGNLNYEADNPFGVTEKGKTFNRYGHDMVYQDDYNVFNNKTSSPIKIEYTGNTKNPFKKDNIESIISGISSNKESLQKAFNVSDQHFNKIAQLALGILEQESKFGTHYRYIGKSAADKIPFTNSTATAVANSNPNSTNINGYTESNYRGETLLDFIKYVSGNNTYDSLGMGQIKMEGDNEETQKMYRMFDVTPESVKSDEKTAEAIMIRLLSMYKNEVQGREFKNKETGAVIDPYDALLYKYKGGNAAKVLRNGEATGRNKYVMNIKKYAKDFKFYIYR